MSTVGTFVITRTSALGLEGLAETFVAQDESGATQFDLKYKMHLGSQEWHVCDASGNEVADMQRHVHLLPTYSIDRPGHPQVTVRKRNPMPVGQAWSIEGLEAGEVTVSGSFTDHEFTFTDPSGQVVAQASRRWATVHEALALRISGLDALIAVCAAVAIDASENEDEGRR